MSTEWTIAITGIIVATILALIIGIPQLHYARRAHQRDEIQAKTEEARRKQDEGNRKQQAAKQERLRLLREEFHSDLNRSRFDMTVGPRYGTGKLRVQIVNRGPHAAADVAATLNIGNQVLALGSATNLVPIGQMPSHVNLGNIAGTYEQGPNNTEVVHPAITGLIEINYTDGNGPQTIQKCLNIGAGSRFDQRQIYIGGVGSDQ